MPEGGKRKCSSCGRVHPVPWPSNNGPNYHCEECCNFSSQYRHEEEERERLQAGKRDGQTWLTIGRAAAYLDVSRWFLRLLVEHGVVKCSRTDRGWRLFLRSDLNAVDSAELQRVRELVEQEHKEFQARLDKYPVRSEEDAKKLEQQMLRVERETSVDEYVEANRRRMEELCAEAEPKPRPIHTGEGLAPLTDSERDRLRRIEENLERIPPQHGDGTPH